MGSGVVYAAGTACETARPRARVPSGGAAEIGLPKAWMLITGVPTPLRFGNVGSRQTVPFGLTWNESTASRWPNRAGRGEGNEAAEGLVKNL